MSDILYSKYKFIRSYETPYYGRVLFTDLLNSDEVGITNKSKVQMYSVDSNTTLYLLSEKEIYDTGLIYVCNDCLENIKNDYANFERLNIERQNSKLSPEFLMLIQKLIKDYNYKISLHPSGVESVIDRMNKWDLLPGDQLIDR